MVPHSQRLRAPLSFLGLSALSLALRAVVGSPEPDPPERSGSGSFLAELNDRRLEIGGREYLTRDTLDKVVPNEQILDRLRQLAAHDAVDHPAYVIRCSHCEWLSVRCSKETGHHAERMK